MGQARNGTVGHEMGRARNGTGTKWPGTKWPARNGPARNGRARNGIYPVKIHRENIDQLEYLPLPIHEDLERL